MRFIVLAACPLVLLTACGDDSSGGPGTVRISLQAEVTIADGLSKGPDEENTKDYGVTYTKFLVAIGNVQLGRSQSGRQLSDPTVYVADLKQVGDQGVEMVKFENVEAGRWDQFGFETPAAAAGARSLAGLGDADLTKMIENGWTHWIEGTVQADSGPVRFTLQSAAPTLFDQCGINGKLGLVAVADGTQSSNITIHGDHLWFNSFPTGDEGTVERRAAWMVAVDKDHDGNVTPQDLASVSATEVFTTQLGYRLDGAPIPIHNALDFVRAQLATQGHFEGEGECIWHFEGTSG